MHYESIQYLGVLQSFRHIGNYYEIGAYQWEITTPDYLQRVEFVFCTSAGWLVCCE